ncbi:MAG: hypothetical protein ACRES7_01415 [Gammaproteobacteria bacterium]
MTRKTLIREIVILTGTTALSGFLFWMAIYLTGALTIIPGALVLFLMLAWYARRMTTLQLVAERTAFACLIAAQASLLAAVAVEVLPTFLHGIV